MRVDIWSDIMCPFCYIGKRKFEKALSQFEHKDNVEVIWHSFQLDPDIQYQPDRNLHDYLAERKGQTRDWSVKAHAQLTQMAKEVGLEYNFDTAILANSFDAHRLIHLAQDNKLGNAAKERLMKAYFTDGKNTGDYDTLVQLGVEIGLDAAEVTQMLQSDDYADDVADDIAEAQRLGIRGVPFFVINSKYAVSGAQSPETFLETLQHAWKEYEQDHPLQVVQTTDGAVCEPGGDC